MDRSKTLYDDFSTWRAWDRHREKCQQLVNSSGVTPRTIKSWKRREEALSLELTELRKKSKIVALIQWNINAFTQYQHL